MDSAKIPVGKKTAVVFGAGGFVGTHMVRRLKSEGYWVRGVDLKWPDFSKTEADEFFIFDLRHYDAVKICCTLNYGVPFEESRLPDEIYNFACLMGGAGFIFTKDNDADIMTSAKINLNLTSFLSAFKVSPKIFYSSSACIYPEHIQEDPNSPGLKESDWKPSGPDSEYGWEKLFSERLYLAYARNYNLDIRIARFHNIYGPEGTYKGGKEKAPAAMCRKAIEAKNMVEVWGTGNQTRSFLYIDDCIDAVRLLMESDFKEPINIGSEEMVTINQLAEMAIDLSGKRLVINNIKGPVGVMGRNSNNDLIRSVLGWTPTYTLKEGMSRTFSWINQQINGL